MNYNTVKGYATCTFIEKKSEFIGHLQPCSREDEALDFLKKIRTEHRKATHNVFAYILSDTMDISRYNDDGEPSGTAGMPVLEVLKKNNLTDICCVITRYFGGIKLGGGGLVRAYSTACKLTIEAAEVIQMTESTKYSLTCNYTEYGKLKYFIDNSDENISVVNENFGANVEIIIIIDSNKDSLFLKKLSDIYNYIAYKIVKLEDLHFNFKSNK